MAEIKKCSCSYPNEKGWHLDEEFKTTYRTLKTDQEQQFRDALAYFLNVYWKKGDAGIEALQKHLDAVSNREIEVFCEWEM